MEETITDSPIQIETPFLLKILQGYSQVDMGSPVFYKHIQEVILYRKFADMTPQAIAEMCSDFQKATNLPRGSQSSFFDEVEKHIRTEMAQGRFTSFPDICRFAETIFSANFGSNEF